MSQKNKFGTRPAFCSIPYRLPLLTKGCSGYCFPLVIAKKSHSFRSESTGFPIAALRVWRLTETNAITNDSAVASTNTHQGKLM